MMTTKPEADVDELMTLLSEQRGLYERLAELSARQRPLIAGDEPEQLLALLSDRQQLVDRLQRIGRRLTPYQQRWPEVRARLTQEESAEIDALVSAVNGLLVTILERDQADAEVLAARKAATTRAMEAVKHSRHAGAAYQAAGARTGPSVEWTDE